MTTLRALQLPPNPVWRSYAGGRVLRRFRGHPDGTDDHFPEDWLASTVRARNGANTQGLDEGLSRFEPAVGVPSVAEALRQQPDFWFGKQHAGRTSPGVLWKLLDSAGRLQVQAHPDARFARQYLHSNAGKTECWYILGTRGEAWVYLGFQNPPKPTEWGEMIRDQRVNEMLACFEPLPVQAGDCFVVPAGTPHAIGAGVFMVELMEPTDWVVRCERVNAGVTLPPEACFMGLDLERCLQVFDFCEYTAKAIRDRCQQSPRVVVKSAAFTEEELIREPWHQYFRLHRLRGTGAARWAGGELLLLIAVSGAGRLTTGETSHSVQAGETWLLPGAAASWQWTSQGGDWELLLAKLPILQTLATS